MFHICDSYWFKKKQKQKTLNETKSNNNDENKHTRVSQ